MRIAIITSVTWAEHAHDVLGAAGHRRGGARHAVVGLLSQEECCLTAQEMHDRLREAGRPVGVASIYRVLDLLVDKGLVERIDTGPGSARFEARHESGEHHHHLVCDACGRVEAFSDEELERAIHEVQERAGARAHHILLRGACADCRAA
jgi:Fur family transcriptional regulator, ferric uptake regulator